MICNSYAMHCNSIIVGILKEISPRVCFESQRRSPPPESARIQPFTSCSELMLLYIYTQPAAVGNVLHVCKLTCRIEVKRGRLELLDI